MARLGLKEDQYSKPEFNLLKALGFSDLEIEEYPSPPQFAANSSTYNFCNDLYNGIVKISKQSGIKSSYSPLHNDITYWKIASE